ncbi:rhomboid family intramembrane serine protease [Segetibacter sp. 3557_3]|uniref:rhomboid family protein n=1 Tax=Segetibacter sp. 3557_3 TaxID=2547429 RepID=UPI001058539B|nr:rhomboid family intramembrane serine protease [Segetibacter sp. 3557_3]TDH26616.1 rhomboid family intramembrane serine protease [Segetibacter sp. 3557_3]
MNTPGVLTFLLIVTNVFFSYRGFKDTSFFFKYRFEVEQVTVYKDYKRLFTSGFLHVGWMHLIFNMLALYFFSLSLEASLGTGEVLILYTAGLVGGNLISLLIHKNDSSYGSVGASGAVFGIMFSSIALFPGMKMGLFLLPISLPGWLFGLAFILFSIYGIRSRSNNIGHDAHLGGALAGMLVAILLHPSALSNNLPTILILTVPAIVFLYIIVKRPSLLLVDNLFFRKRRQLTVEDKYNMRKRNKQEELDQVLEKIHTKGMSSLSKKEKELLQEFSR